MERLTSLTAVLMGLVQVEEVCINEHTNPCSLHSYGELEGPHLYSPCLGSLYTVDSTSSTYRCEEQVRELQSSQKEVSAELEERRAHCQQLRESLEGVEREVVQAEENKRQVGYG